MSLNEFAPWQCPLCGAPLAGDVSLKCARNHSFDRAKEGYWHLLPVQSMRTKAPGDSKEMVAARRAFLNAGYYGIFGQAAGELCLEYGQPAAPGAALHLLDAGCGVMSDMVSTAFGSLAMMTSVLVSPDGTTEYEAAHGTVTKHYYRHLRGEETSTNPMATIFAWTGALRKRGQLDGLTELEQFAGKLEQACFTTLNQGTMTKDLVGLVDEGVQAHAVTSAAFLAAVRGNLEASL